ncbi:MAG: hypothetical protein GYB65_22940 [Chloroflexi bacterium]|nr:hypothetical protein [Chloroflexota bacterium]
MRTCFFIIIGFVFLAGAAAIAWSAYSPIDDQVELLGGKLFTVGDVLEAQGIQPPTPEPPPGPGDDDAAEQPAPTMAPAVVGERPVELEVAGDVPSGNFTYTQPVEIEAGALERVEALESAAPAAVAETELPAGTTTTSDYVLGQETEVTVAPLAMGGGLTEGGQGGLGTEQQRVVELEWPEEFRVGSSSTIRVTFKALDGGGVQPVAEIDGNEVLATPIIFQNRFEGGLYEARVTANLAAPDFDVDLQTEETQTITFADPMRELEWRWTLNADKGETAVIVISLSMTWFQTSTNTPLPNAQNIQLWSQAVEVEAKRVLGMLTVPQAGIAGTVLAVIGLLAEIPLLEKLLETIWDILFGGGGGRDDRRDKRRGRSRNRRRR